MYVISIDFHFNFQINNKEETVYDEKNHSKKAYVVIGMREQKIEIPK